MKIRVLFLSIFLKTVNLLSSEPEPAFIETTARTMEFCNNTLITVNEYYPDTSKIFKNCKRAVLEGSDQIYMKREFICQEWDIETGKLITDYNTNEDLGEVCISKEGLVANLNINTSSPLLSIYNVRTKNLLYTIKLNYQVASNDGVYFTGFFDDKIYLHGITWDNKKQLYHYYTRKFNIKTGKEEHIYNEYLRSINESETIGFRPHRDSNFPFIIFDLQKNKVTFQNPIAKISSAHCWLTDEVFVTTPYAYTYKHPNTTYTHLQIMAQNTKGEITCTHKIEPTENNFIYTLGKINNDHVLSSDHAGIIKCWDMSNSQEEPKQLIDFKKPASQIKSKQNALTAILLKYKIALCNSLKMK